MTEEEAKKEARELVDKYINLVPEEFGGMGLDLAKECALICAEKLIDEHTQDAHDDYTWDSWQKVKKEIINLK